jgi:oxygen-independent coproporphyrinogen-3 oxidase
MDPRLLPFALADVPRYTSYPTAVQFQNGFSGGIADQWLADLKPVATLSAYVHIPFCQQLCWYCGCHTSVPNGYDRAARYVDFLIRDIARAGSLCGADKGAVKHFHFGGGTPTYLTNDDLGRIVSCVQDSFGLARGAEVAIESDPRGITPERAYGLAAIGFNRISFGVQDFALPVQMKINRLQPHGLVANATTLLRKAGFVSVNFDLMYGLPGQTLASVRQTARQAAEMKPNRLSVFGYAHVPWFAKHQRMIKDEDLPGVSERYEQAMAIAEELCASGYVMIGLDHFALPEDELSEAAKAGRLRRNFQGYTTDTADALIAFGASAISEFPQGFTQAARDTLAWSEAIDRDENPVSRGLATTAEDRMRSEIIERLMCDFTVDFDGICSSHGFETALMDEAKVKMVPLIEAGIAVLEGGRLTVQTSHRLFLRSVAATFDTHFVNAAKRHAKAV